MIDNIKFDDRGLVPAIIQDYKSGQVLMLAYMNEESLQKTIESGQTWFYSRSRQELWHKGATSGNTQEVKNIRYDCDGDTILVKVEQTGVACHTGNYSCFYRGINEQDDEIFNPEKIYGGQESAAILYELYELIKSRQKEMPEGSYTTYLFDKGIDKILKKVGEESAEVIIAAKNRVKGEVLYESADLVYHLLVLLVEQGVELSDLFAELRARR
jgi:phosphoribosyl-ATP pyrophosphohydrolase/phosphoribosyl-AMP cyclohydrolase